MDVHGAYTTDGDGTGVPLIGFRFCEWEGGIFLGEEVDFLFSSQCAHGEYER